MPPRDAPDLTVYITSRDAACDACHEDLGRGAGVAHPAGATTSA